MMFRRALYIFDCLVILALWGFKADVELDFTVALYVTSMLLANLLMIIIRKNPGVATIQVIEPSQLAEDKLSSDEFELDQRTNYQLGTTLKLKELQDNLLEPEISLRAPHNIMDYEEEQHSEEGDNDYHQERYDSVETIREGQ